MTDPTDALAAALHKVLPRRGDLVSRTDWDNAASGMIAALAASGWTLTPTNPQTTANLGGSDPLAALREDDWPPPGVHRHGDGCGHLRPTPWSPR